MTPLALAAQSLRDLLNTTAIEADPRVQVEPDEARQVLVVTTGAPKELARIVPLRHAGFPVKLVATEVALVAPATVVAPVVEVLPARRSAASTALERPDEDARLWEAIAGRADALSGLDFSVAARIAPLRVEAIVHSHIHAGFARMQGPGAEAAQRGTYLLRNQTLRQVHGTITSSLLADQLRRSGEDHATLFLAQRQAMGDAFVQQAAPFLDDIRRGFSEARAVALRAADATDGETRDGWAQVAIVVRAMGEAMLEVLRPGPLPRAIGGARAIGAAPRRIGG